VSRNHLASFRPADDDRAAFQVVHGHKNTADTGVGDGHQIVRVCDRSKRGELRAQFCKIQDILRLSQPRSREEGRQEEVFIRGSAAS
jgi:hypothetical protein